MGVGGGGWEGTSLPPPKSKICLHPPVLSSTVPAYLSPRFKESLRVKMKNQNQFTSE